MLCMLRPFQKTTALNAYFFKLDGKSVEMEVDTGATATIISEKMWRQLGSPVLSESNRAFTAYDGHRMKPIGEHFCSIMMMPFKPV